MSERPVLDQLLSQMRYAIAQERYSQIRYRESAKLARTPELRSLLQELANEEALHETKLIQALQNLIKNSSPL